MNLERTGLVLEGGGLRGVYLAGVLRLFMDRQLYLPYVIGVSSGACNGANYVARQPERNRIVNISHIKDPRYISYRRLLRRGELFGMHFLFDTLPNRLVPFDFKTFMASPVRHVLGVTDCVSGQALYFDQRQAGAHFLTLLRASCSLPFMAPPVRFNGRVLMDGGIADSVPIHKSIADGNRRHVLVLTRPRGYRKKPSAWSLLVRLRYGRYPGLCRQLNRRHHIYNDTQDAIDALEADGRAFVIRPPKRLTVARVERNQEKLCAAYDQGYLDAVEWYPDLCDFLNRTEKEEEGVTKQQGSGRAENDRKPAAVMDRGRR